MELGNGKTVCPHTEESNWILQKKLKMDQIKLNLKHEMLDYLKENVGNTLKDNGSGHEFLNMT